MEVEKMPKLSEKKIAANARYSRKTYTQYLIKLRKVEDAEIIAAIEAKKASGIMPTEYFRQLFRNK